MRYSFIFSLFLLLSNITIGQDGYNDIIDFGGTGSAFKNILLKEDTLVLIGSIRVNDSLPWGILFAKMDTLGNVLDFKIHYDSLNDDYASTDNISLIQTTDGGYASVAILYYRDWGVLMKLDQNGNLNFVKEYPDDNLLFTDHRKLMELEDGYLIAGNKQQQTQNYNLDVFIKKTDLDGNEIWEKSYGQSNKNESLSSFLKVDPNTFVIGGVKFHLQNTPFEQTWQQPWIFAIDSLGVQKWTWSGPQYEEAAVHGLKLTSDGGWIYGSYTHEILYDYDSFGGRLKLVKRDSAFNLVWSKNIGQRVSILNIMRELKSSLDGNWVAIGNDHLAAPAPDSLQHLGDSVGWQSGLIYKISNEGDSLWAVEKNPWGDPVPPLGTRSFLSGMVILPSGSVIAAGYSNNNNPAPRSYAWLLKLDKNGCIDTLCTAVSTSPFIQAPKPKLKLYPNPNRGLVHLEFADAPKGLAQMNIYDSFGRKVESFFLNLLSTDHTLKLDGIPSGVYFYAVVVNNQEIFSGKFIVQ